MDCVRTEDRVHLSGKGGLQTIPFIIASEGCERTVGGAVGANLIIYLTNEYRMGATTSALILFAYQAAASFLPIFGAIVSDALLGRFLTITLTLFASSIGTVLLWLTTMFPKLVVEDCGSGNQRCYSPTPLQIFLLFSSLLFLSIGTSGVRPCSLAFGVDQFGNQSGPRKERALKVLFASYYVSMGASQIIALTVIVYLQERVGWKIGFGVQMALMALVTISNVVASPLYIKVKPQKSTWVSFYQVISTAIKNRHIEIPESSSGTVQYNSIGGSIVAPSRRMRFLNRACVLRTHADTSDTQVQSSTSVCTVQQVEDLKTILSVLPTWSAMIMNYVILNGQTFRVLQAETMVRRVCATKFVIPAGSITIFEVVTFTLFSGCYDRYIMPVLRKITGRETVFTHKQRMGIGLMFYILSAVVSSAVEAVRRKEAVRQGLEDNADGIVNMSVYWLVPQCILGGLGSVFAAIGQIEFYYSVLPKAMGSLALALLILEGGVASLEAMATVKIVKAITGTGGRVNWLQDNLNRGRYDYYYLLLAVLGVANFMYFLACCYWFEEPTPNQHVESSED